MSYTRINKMHYTKVSPNVKHYFSFLGFTIRRQDSRNSPTHSPPFGYLCILHIRQD